MLSELHDHRFSGLAGPQSSGALRQACRCLPQNARTHTQPPRKTRSQLQAAGATELWHVRSAIAGCWLHSRATLSHALTCATELWHVRFAVAGCWLHSPASLSHALTCATELWHVRVDVAAQPCITLTRTDLCNRKIELWHVRVDVAAQPCITLTRTDLCLAGARAAVQPGPQQPQPGPRSWHSRKLPRLPARPAGPAERCALFGCHTTAESPCDASL